MSLLDELTQQFPTQKPVEAQWLGPDQKLFVHKLALPDLLHFINAADAANDKEATFGYALELVAKTIGEADGKMLFDSEAGREWLKRNAMKALDLMRQSQTFNELTEPSGERKKG